MTNLLTVLGLLACGGSQSDTACTDTAGCEVGGTDGGTTDGGTTDGGTTDGGTSAQESTNPDDGYYFPSAFAGGQSSVSYSGQILRHLLIDDMKTHLAGMTERLNTGDLYPAPGDVEAELEFYLEFDSGVGGSVEHSKDTNGEPLQRTYDEVSSGKNLLEKLAGNDEVGQHKDWSAELVGWGAEGSVSPEGLVRQWFATIDAQAVAWAGGDPPLDPWGEPVPAVYVTPEGQDLQQLLEKFLRGAVAFSQGADDYLDDDIEGKGLLSDHTGPDGDKPYTALEHAWDEGFGYFGAARTYPDWTDEEIADYGSLDVNGDGYIDLLSEVSWGHSVNAAKRDVGSADLSPTDLTAEAWGGFHGGRLLLSQTAGSALSEAELDELRGYRDAAVSAWEQAMAATVVHYINEVLQDMGELGTDAYSFADHAKHWSELKGFALCLQFNPRSPIADEDFSRLHQLVGTAPVLSDPGLDAYADDLREARDIVGAAYGFDPLQLGDDSGAGGW